ncbi:hypothetical protein BBF96_09670 [Anoxybacter fermentans]|uniref:DNA-binding protein n=1 Tax=Anoxybacter fermentans TaxID=1323375 RepID=A0A3Q9HQZ0_9FIRM|nr:hypothetical protein [Anoxybacter fermentans]AZR73631.1 hypothetical protein BBF96_09670 [Anoxybacter fermentans]
MDKRKAKKYEVKGYKLVCPICGHERFWTRKTLMNTPGVTFLGFDWANKEADNYICENCGYIMWFWSK